MPITDRTEAGVAAAPREGGRTLRLRTNTLTEAGRALRLRGGDVLVALNGQPFRGDGAQLVQLAQSLAGTGPLVLTFARGDQVFPVLTPTIGLGGWEGCDAPPTPTDPASVPADPAGLTNWEVLRDRRGNCDIYSMSPPRMALILPLFWLAQMRLWVPAATLATALLVSFVVLPFLAVAVHLVAGAHFWRLGPKHLREDRLARGLWPSAVLAAATEADAIRLYDRLWPGGTFRFGGATEVPAAEAGSDAGPVAA